MSLYQKIKNSLFPRENGSPGFIPQFRLESRSRDPNNETGLEMRIADPLWMLGRQWQFGEFKGEDNGSPISVRTNFRKEPTTHYTFPDHTEIQPLNGVPLEAKIEALRVDPQDLRSKVRIGQKMEALIREQFPATEAAEFIDKLRTEYPLTSTGSTDRKSIGFFKMMSGRVTDGGKLWDHMLSQQFPQGDFLPLQAVTEILENWYRTLFVPADAVSAWESRQLAHRFRLHHQDAIQLEAPDYQSGHLDWYSFDTAGINIDPTKKAQDSEALMPVRVSFAAMPDKRLFAFEDSKLDLAGMQVDQDDLVRLMIIDFSLVSGSDWFTIPVNMELGELCWINHLTVKDVFGVQTKIRNSEGQFLGTDPLNVWDAYKIRNENVSSFEASQHFLYLAPSIGFRQESRPLEELLFLRDEYANMVWGIEKTVCNEMGKPTDGYDLHLELNGPFLRENNEAEATNGSIPQFRLASPVPTNWIPYLPFHIEDSNTDIELRRAVMMRNEADTDPTDIDPISRLARTDLLTIREEAIPRAGVRVQLTRQRVRWTDGKTYIWLGRKVLAGKGEGSSGLSFDQLKY